MNLLSAQEGAKRFPHLAPAIKGAVQLAEAVYVLLRRSVGANDPATKVATLNEAKGYLAALKSGVSNNPCIVIGGLEAEEKKVADLERRYRETGVFLFARAGTLPDTEHGGPS